jgi:predicted dehydrogenase
MTRSRRQFLQYAAGAAAGLCVSSRGYAANETIHVACVGVRGQGNSLLRTFAAQRDVHVTHICDLDESVRTQRGLETEKTTKKMPKLVVDYRTVLDGKDIDAVVIGTPDHWHALPAVHACMAKKDVYVEKPDGHNINEGKAMVAAARKYDRMVQLGTQARSAAWLKEARDFVAAGGIGKVIMGKAWETDRQRPVPKVKDADPPKGVDYDLWLGPAPERPFNRNRFHGSWRWYFDYGCGDLGNDGVHRLDYCRYVMGVEALPSSVSASGGKFFFDDDQEWPDTMMITYDYPGKILTYEMRIWSKPRLHGITEGAAIHGDEGWVLVSNTGWKAYDGAGKEVKAGGGPNALNEHVRNFLEAVKSRKRESLNQEIASGHVSSVLCHAGNIAWRTGKKLKLDARTETFDDAEANKHLGREYRKGFELPKV